MEVTCYSETSVLTKPIRHHIPEYGIWIVTPCSLVDGYQAFLKCMPSTFFGWLLSTLSSEGDITICSFEDGSVRLMNCVSSACYNSECSRVGGYVNGLPIAFHAGAGTDCSGVCRVREAMFYVRSSHVTSPQCVILC
jgi:hypothetical protein